MDEYFNLRFANPSEAKKPTQNMPNQISEIIEYLGSSISPEKIRFAHYLMDLASDAREELADKIEYAFRRQRELKRAVPLAAFGEIKYCAFISMPGIIQYPIQEQIDYAYAAASRDEKSRTFSSNSKRSHILRTSSRSRRLILSSIVSFAVSLKWTRTI